MTKHALSLECNLIVMASTLIAMASNLRANQKRLLCVFFTLGRSAESLGFCQKHPLASSIHLLTQLLQ